MAIQVKLPQRGRRPGGMNMTPMVDVVFLLMIFFMLVSRFISEENIQVELPNPDHSLAQEVEYPDRVILNCQYVGGPGPEDSGVRYQLGPIRVQSLAELQERLQTVAQNRPDVQLILRADRKIRYKLVREAMQVIARAGIKNVNIAAELKE